VQPWHMGDGPPSHGRCLFSLLACKVMSAERNKERGAALAELAMVVPLMGGESPGQACRQDVPLPPIPFFDHGTKNVDTSAINAICDTTYGDKDIDNTLTGNFGAVAAGPPSVAIIE
jgi:hypothetical protein